MNKKLKNEYIKNNGRNEENHFSETQTQNKFAVYKKIFKIRLLHFEKINEKKTIRDCLS